MDRGREETEPDPSLASALETAGITPHEFKSQIRHFKVDDQLFILFEGYSANPRLSDIQKQLESQSTGLLHFALEFLKSADPGGTPPVPDPLEQLKVLGELRDSGVLTAEEFEQQKAELLGRL